MTRAELAKQHFLEGCNCAQAVLLAFGDLIDADRQLLARASIGLGGGMGRLREVCGAVSGAAMAIGLLFPSRDKAEIYRLVREHAAAFRAENGSYLCRELLEGKGIVTENTHLPEARTEAYYRKRPCPELVACSAAILEELLAREQ